MKRIRTILLCLLLGAIVNVAVAWRCVCSSEVYTSNPYGVEGMPWPAPVPDDWPQYARLWTLQGFGYSRLMALGYPSPLLDDPRIATTNQIVLRAGWPLHSLFVERHRVEIMGDSMTTLTFSRLDNWRDGLRIPDWMPRNPQGRRIVFPTRPLWSGFIINTSFYAVIPLLLISGTFTLRTQIRRNRGLCVKCAYDLKGAEHEACPECGSVIAKAKPT